MDQFITILKAELAYYAGRGINCYGFPLFDDEHQTYGVNLIDYPKREMSSEIVVFARVVDDFIVIEEDTTDRPLYRALVERGIPREKICLIYAGEAYPENAVPSDPNPFLLEKA